MHVMDHYSSLQCHMILRNHSDLLLKKHLLLLSMLKRVVLLLVLRSSDIFSRENKTSLRNVKGSPMVSGCKTPFSDKLSLEICEQNQGGLSYSDLLN